MRRIRDSTLSEIQTNSLFPKNEHRKLNDENKVYRFYALHL